MPNRKAESNRFMQRALHLILHVAFQATGRSGDPFRRVVLDIYRFRQADTEETFPLNAMINKLFHVHCGY
jgi:hypothetical protein